jgi:hypothetical protein
VHALLEYSLAGDRPWGGHGSMGRHATVSLTCLLHGWVSRAFASAWREQGEHLAIRDDPIVIGADKVPIGREALPRRPRLRSRRRHIRGSGRLPPQPYAILTRVPPRRISTRVASTTSPLSFRQATAKPRMSAGSSVESTLFGAGTEDHDQPNHSPWRSSDFRTVRSERLR